jgi:hypothetical protein
LKQADFRDMMKMVSRVSVHQSLWYLLTYCLFPSTSPARKTPENTKEDPYDPEPAGGGDNQNKILF